MSGATVIMAKAPRAGLVKTRLEPVLGAERCAALQAEMLRHAAQVAASCDAPVEVHVAPRDAVAEVGGLVPPGVRLVAQAGGDLGARMAAAVRAAHRRHGGPVVVIGVDLPALRTEHLAAARRALAGDAGVCLGPSRDGGYYLVGVREPADAVLDLPASAWGGPRVLELTLAAARAAGLRVALLEPAADVDTPDDARRAAADPSTPRAIAALLAPAEPLVSVIVPTLDEEATIAEALDHLARLAGRVDVVVVDGGSSDRTVALARAHPARPRVVEAQRGRAAQMNAGAAAAGGDALVFLHADTRLPDDAHAQIARALRSTAVGGGNFAVRFDGPGRFARVLTAWYALQRRLGVFYGDSAIWLRASTFRELGGYRPLAIMEDYDLARRLRRRGRTACLRGPVRSSARRWERLGVARTIASWVVIRWLFVAGVSPERLARLYPVAR